jgi:hypothetical protein
MKGPTTGAQGIRRDGGGRLSAEGPMKSSKNNVTSHFMGSQYNKSLLRAAFMKRFLGLSVETNAKRRRPDDHSIARSIFSALVLTMSR